MDNRLGSLCPRQRRCGIGPTWGWTFCGETAINDLELQAWGNNIRTLVKGLLSNSDYAAPGWVERRLTQVKKTEQNDSNNESKNMPENSLTFEKKAKLEKLEQTITFCIIDVAGASQRIGAALREIKDEQLFQSIS